ncbi:MAG: hypothetical protein MSIBF_03770 [Candidatus Altiarchaeales archaeon IMC4]|nr:MAG: hypothetical protein MSIBF_03770 [Candidatus Altiarchaeales archaeon IMC4]
MLSANEIKSLAIRNQTTDANIAREYTQHVFLSYLYQKKNTENLLFKGGTALRMAYGSPRFSEDLDYTAPKFSSEEIKRIMEETLKDMRNEGFEIRAEYHKTSGGWLIPMETKVLSWPVRIEQNLSSRKAGAQGQFQLIANPYTPPYSANLLTEEELVLEKMDALRTRKKPRDFYDLYFILRSNLTRKPIISKREQLNRLVDCIDDAKMKRELKAFLPASHWPVLANLKANLKKELERV